MEKIKDLYIKNRRRYVNMMSNILRGDRASAEDVVQEAFTRAIKFKNSYDENRGELSTWFNRILFNSLRDLQKEIKISPQQNIKDFSVDDILAEEFLMNSPELRNFVLEKIADCENEKHQQILGLFFIGGYTSTEISQIEKKVSVSNVTTIVTRFRKNLVDELNWEIKKGR